MIIFGIFVLRGTIKTWDKKTDIFTTNMKGLIASISFLIIGIMLLIGKVHW